MEDVIKRGKKNRAIAFVIATLVVLSLAVCVYMKQLTKTTDASVVASMQELSRHDMQNIQSELENSWDSLSAVYTRTQTSRCATIQDVCRRLNLEQISNIFNTIYLVDSDGNTYSSSNVIKNEKEKKYVLPLLSGQDKVVMRYDDLDVLETLTESLVYGVRCAPFQVDGIQFIGIIGFSKINLIADRLKIDSFDGRGYTGIIDIDGNYVVNRDRSAGIGEIDNYFEQLQNCAGLSKKDISDITARIGQGEELLLHFNYIDQGAQVVSFIPMPGTTWSIVLTVPREVFREQTQQFVLMTVVMLVVVVMVLCLMMFVIVRISLISATARAEAKSRGEFLSNMSHEIRTPLNGIIGLIHLMQQNIGDPERMTGYLRKSDSTAKYLLSLVNDILDMSKLQSDKMVLVPKPFSVNELISTTEALMRSRMEDKGIDFRVETSIICSGLVGDDIRIEQILVNILGNAVKFTPEGGHVTMRVFQSAEGGRILTTYQVEDTGCGMSEEFQQKIFEPFSQERSSQGSKGTGLGMSISSLLAKQMGGTLTVMSRLGEGSCFTFALMSEMAPDDSVGSVVEDNVHQVRENEKKLHILVAEDNDLNAEILMEILAASDFTAVRAADGGEVVELFEKSPPYEFDIILMDLQMPVRNGYEATKLIRRLNRPDAKKVIIYACTANTFREDQDQAREAGMDGFIAKPIDVNKLMQKLGAGK
ncbi:hybrid sensor histidine kinase/response regulator [uncultured Clostridium sp.]|uniref:hybrid sensor histidine kinase/response regulator n=1 Tax=uncultured Clostridium sp. TaxID=59620 RepID=UPI0025E87D93|nr:hybrid sensor histidine kinase/response regulator [uncultured Clostridium sp.]